MALEAPVLGGGAFAEVFRVRHRETKQNFAVKVMHRPNFTLRGIEKQITMEIRAMELSAIDAEEAGKENNIVTLIDHAEEGEYVFLLLELCEQGDLLRKLYGQPGQRFPEALAYMWSRQLLEGLATLHRLGVIHRDVKPDNLLCTEQGMLKIADFGWCCEATEAPTSLAGTFQYMAPEVLQNHPQTEKADVWSAGVTLHQLLVGKPLLNTYLGPGATNLTQRDPHEATAVKQRWLVEEIKSTCPPSPDLCPQDISPLCWDFLRRLLVPDVKARASVAEALQHPWLQAPIRSVNSEAGSVTICRSGSAAVGRSEAPIEEARESDEEEPSEPEAAGGEVVLAMARDEQVSSTPEAPASHVVLASPIRPTQGIELRSPLSDDHESIDNVPTPNNPRSWDPNRNMAYSPPCKAVETAPECSDALEAKDRSPERSPERCGSPERRRLHESPERKIDDVDNATSAAMPSTPQPSSPVEACRLLSTPGRDLEVTPREAVLPPRFALPAPGAMAMAAMKAAGIEPGPKLRQGQQTPLPPSPMPTSSPLMTDPVPLVAAPYSRLSPMFADRNVSPTGIGRAVRRTSGIGGPPTVSAPRLRLSAPGDLLGGSMPAGVLSTGATPQLAGSAGLPNASPNVCTGLRDVSGSWRLRPRPEPSVDPHALLTELHHTNENLRMAFVQLVSNIRKSGCTSSAASAANLERMVREDVAQTAALLEPFLPPPGSGAASAPVASPVPKDREDVKALAMIESTFGIPHNDLYGAMPDILSATAPSLSGASTPGVLAPILSARDMKPSRLRADSGAWRASSEMTLTSARDRENAPPSNMSAAEAWFATKQPLKARNASTCQGTAKPRHAGSLQVRQGSMPRYGRCSGRQAMTSQSHLDALSQTVSHTTVVRECRTPLVPTMPRASSPQSIRCTLPIKAQAISKSNALPPPRLVASHQSRGNGVAGTTTLPQRVTTTPVSGAAAPQHLWAYPTGTCGHTALQQYTGQDRRRASVSGAAYYTR